MIRLIFVGAVNKLMVDLLAENLQSLLAMLQRTVLAKGILVMI